MPDFADEPTTVGDAPAFTPSSGLTLADQNRGAGDHFVGQPRPWSGRAVEPWGSVRLRGARVVR
jgi:hypothetical protein